MWSVLTNEWRSNGYKTGPSYACLFMGHFEQKLLQNYSKPVPEIYKRYIGGGIGATSMSHSQLMDFTEFVQNFHPAVKFTYKISEQSVAFLVIDIYPKRGKLKTSVHYKVTDSHSYLDYRSSHNPSTKNNIPSSRLLTTQTSKKKRRRWLNSSSKDNTLKT